MRTQNYDKKAIIVFSFIVLAWIGAWNIKIVLDNHFDVFSDEWLSFLYWTIAKLIIWILPALWLIGKTGRTVRDILHVPSWCKCFAWGIGLGGILIFLSIGGRYLNDTPILPSRVSFALVNAIIIAPIFEEFLIRGAIMGALRQKHSFFFANSVSAIFFVILHFPGWYYTGNLLANLQTITGGAAAIFMIGWLCGLAREKGKSVTAGVIVHFLNNLI